MSSWLISQLLTQITLSNHAMPLILDVLRQIHPVGIHLSLCVSAVPNHRHVVELSDPKQTKSFTNQTAYLSISLLQGILTPGPA